MAEGTAFHGIVQFLQDLGVYDVILPFLLIFTLVFAILEKTKILGTEEIGGKAYTKKNLNAIVSFSISFLVIASAQLVAVINKVMANVVLLLILAICFLLLVGVFFGDKQFTLENYPRWTKFFMIFMFLGIVVIFLHAFDWLKYILFIFASFQAEWAATIIFLIVIIGFIAWITKSEKPAAEKK